MAAVRVVLGADRCLVYNEFDNKPIIWARKSLTDCLHERLIISDDLLEALLLRAVRKHVREVVNLILNCILVRFGAVHLHDFDCGVLEILPGLGNAIASVDPAPEGELRLQHLNRGCQCLPFQVSPPCHPMNSRPVPPPRVTVKSRFVGSVAFGAKERTRDAD